jgi:zinc-binding in reverse transcriptase
MLSNKILTIDNMIKKGWAIPNMCYLCRNDLEMVRHICSECSFTQQLRAYITNMVPLEQDSCRAFTLQASADIIIQKENHMYWRQLEVVTVFTIWKERCHGIFDEKE